MPKLKKGRLKKMKLKKNRIREDAPVGGALLRKLKGTRKSK